MADNMSDGVLHWLAEAREHGYQRGHAAGYEKGHIAGYRQGHEEGYELARQHYSPQDYDR